MLYCWTKRIIDDWVGFLDTHVRREISEAQKDLARDPAAPDRYMRATRPDLFFLLELLIVIFVAFSMYHWAFFFNYLADTPGSIRLDWSVADVPFEQLMRVEQNRDSWLRWYEYFYRQDPFAYEHAGGYYLELGNLIRPFFDYLINIVMPAFILGYCVWFFIKYYRYVIAAMWGWFMMTYTFVTKKVECSLAKKWYISFVTGWKKCKPPPTFSAYVSRWYRRFVQRPMRQEQLQYVGAADALRNYTRVSILGGARALIASIARDARRAVDAVVGAVLAFVRAVRDVLARAGAAVADAFAAVAAAFGFGAAPPPPACTCPPAPAPKNTPDGAPACEDSLMLDLAVAGIVVWAVCAVARPQLPAAAADTLARAAGAAGVQPATLLQAATLVAVVTFYTLDAWFYRTDE